MNLTTMLSRLRERVGNPDTTDVPDATLTARINEAYSFIWDRYRFHANRTTDSSIVTVAGTASYALPADCDIIMSVRDVTNTTKLKKIGKDKYDAKGVISNGKPTEYFRENNNLILWTTPDGAYTIRVRYKQAMTELSAGADIPSVPTAWHDGIVALARFMYWDTKGDVPKAQYAFRMWKEWVSDKSNEIDEELFQDYDEGVSVPTLEQPLDRLDFDHSD